MILGHNFSKAFCTVTLWDADDVMSLTRNGMPFAETLPTHDINALVFLWNLQLYHLPPMDISSVSYPEQKENHALAGVVCLNPHSNTDLYTHTVIHMKDW